MTDQKRAGMYRLQTASAGSGQEQHETYGDHAAQSCMAARQRLKLVVQEFRKRIRQSASGSKKGVRGVIKNIEAEVGLLASRKLHSLARRIEQKVEIIRRS
jgi:hypothetical protein